jgi:hypothetical protein
MSSLQRVASKVKPTAVKTTITLFDASRKATVQGFGSGILPFVPHSGRKPFTSADAQAAAELFATEAAEDAERDRLADEAAFLDRYVSGRTWL